MYTSVNADYKNDLQSWNAIDDQLKHIAEKGFTHVSWMFDWDGEFMYTLPEMLQAKQALREYGLIAHTLHADHGGQRGFYVKGEWNPTPGQRCTFARKEFTNHNDLVRLGGVDLLINRIELCSHIGAHEMILHLQLPWQHFRENPDNKKDYYECAFKSLDAVQPLAKAAGVRIDIENFFNTPEEDEIEKYNLLFDRYDDDFIGMCFDSGHASLTFLDNPYTLLEMFPERVHATHLQDNELIDPKYVLKDFKKVANSDLHILPYTGKLDWDRLARGVAKSAVELPADFEVGFYGKTKEEEEKWLDDCYNASVRFHNDVIKYREQGK